GNAAHGRVLFTDPDMICASCHTPPTGMGTNSTWNGASFDQIPAGSGGEGHAMLVPPTFQRTQNFKIPSLRSLYDRVGYEGSSLASRAGFGTRHDGAGDSLERYVARPFIPVTSDQDVADIVAFILSMSGDDQPNTGT